MVQKPSCRSCAEHSWFWCLVSSQYLISMKWITCWSMLRPLVWCLWLVLAVLLRCSQSYPLIGPCHSKCQLGKTEEYDKLIMTKTKRVQTAKSSTFHHSNGTMHLHKARWQEKKEKNYAGSENHSPHYLRKNSHFGTEYRKALPPQKGKEKSMGIRRVAGLAWNRLLMRVDNSTGKGTSSMDKFSSKVHGVHMELGGKLLKSLRI
jgi:hypothetical protein